MAVPLPDERAIMDAVGRCTVADLANYLTSKNATVICSSCNKNDWSLTAPSEAILNLHMTTPNDVVAGNFVVGGRSVPTVLLQCNHCGFMRLHNAMQVGSWKLQNEKKG